MDSSRQQDLAAMRDLYPDLDPRVRRIAAAQLMQLIEVASVHMPCTDEERLHRLHRLLELCTIEHEFEVQGYQAAHRRLLEYEEESRRMLQIRDVPQCAFVACASSIGQRKDVEKANMKESRKQTKAILRAIRYAEEQMKETETVVAAQGKAEWLLGVSNHRREQTMARLAANREAAEQIHDDPQTRSLIGKQSACKGKQPACDSGPDR
ncbi:MAG: hypothetical protein L6R38_002718 [Xanthoria sp. 2 TBL-2021]|nr:MAG: hypothetical protein L6R38_002718 [Xanthoria sp. 2 TBL-2021]